ncbi:MarR family winged helix-turn-helix transcriptional regulator [Streptomyces olivochromogenes]|uniref:MarR family transcriptional regulator n=1 Tax=Streptomyces olivochromogenes TaxID=1963 RepID=A0A250V9P2_STROL|nr:MarR family transcriptional regulator [Streptomyces olivochromogenes]KUN48488.1 MarR family transcriptional regulator [Streptomyces olivochromogenes]GAX50885.1 MarR family transcriptional regulator [Streptomyces olivochromogenes]
MHNNVMDPGGSGEELIVALEQLVRYVRQVSTAGGLSSAASSVLGRLGREGPQRVTELARGEGVSQPGMTQLVTRMERDGLVRRIASTDDRRGVLVEATDAGADVVRERHAERAEALRELMDRLDPQERSAVAIALPALARLIQAQASK